MHPALLSSPDVLGLVEGGRLRLPQPESIWHREFLAELAARVRPLPEIAALEEAQALEERLRGEVGVLEGTRIIGIYGHAGSGRSTLLRALAAGLQAAGRRVGLLDADLQTRGLSERLLPVQAPPLVVGGLVLTAPLQGLRLQTLGAFWPERGPLPWQGRELQRVLGRFRADVLWGRPDFLLLDLPPLGDPRLGDVLQTFAAELWRVDGPLGTGIAGPPARRRIANAGGRGGDLQLPYAPEGDLLSTFSTRLLPLALED